MITNVTRIARWIFAFEFLINGLNGWWRILPYPTVFDPPLSTTPPFVQAMLDTGYLFGAMKAVEVLGGLMLFANRFVPLTLVLCFPVTVGAWSIDFFLLQESLRAQVMGWSVLLLNTYLLFAYLRYYAPMLVSRSNPIEPAASEVPPPIVIGPNSAALVAFGFIAVAVGLWASGWLVLMAARQLLP
ncbi:MAG: hypothetical protein HC809_00470 [Gammaproteobacteria bacterium]|nr:hypothetical protein [Gammaproteobacteria bacterium]